MAMRDMEESREKLTTVIGIKINETTLEESKIFDKSVEKESEKPAEAVETETEKQTQATAKDSGIHIETVEIEEITFVGSTPKYSIATPVTHEVKESTTEITDSKAAMIENKSCDNSGCKEEVTVTCDTDGCCAKDEKCNEYQFPPVINQARSIPSLKELAESVKLPTISKDSNVELAADGVTGDTNTTSFPASQVPCGSEPKMEESISSFTEKLEPDGLKIAGNVKVEPHGDSIKENSACAGLPDTVELQCITDDLDSKVSTIPSVKVVKIESDAEEKQSTEIKFVTTEIKRVSSPGRLSATNSRSSSPRGKLSPDKALMASLTLSNEDAKALDSLILREPVVVLEEIDLQISASAEPEPSTSTGIRNHSPRPGSSRSPPDKALSPRVKSPSIIRARQLQLSPASKIQREERRSPTTKMGMDSIKKHIVPNPRSRVGVTQAWQWEGESEWKLVYPQVHISVLDNQKQLHAVFALGFGGSPSVRDGVPGTPLLCKSGVLLVGVGSATARV